MAAQTQERIGAAADPDLDKAGFGKDGLARSQRLLDKILSFPEPLSFAEFTALVMMHPQLGYYPCVGKAEDFRADFITAPEITCDFARCLAHQWVGREVLASRGSGGYDILELGPGSGRFASDALLALAKSVLEPRRYLLHEPSAGLEKVQRRRLEDELSGIGLRTSIEWVNSLEGLEIEGIVFANEVADVLPVEILRRRKGRIERLFVEGDAKSRRLTELWQDASPELAAELESLESRLARVFDDGYRIEVQTGYERWLEGIDGALAAGEIWIIDYGGEERHLYHPHRSLGTVKTHCRHRRIDQPLERPGLQDISFEVNFDRLARLARDRGLGFIGYKTQGNWLIDAGIHERDWLKWSFEDSYQWRGTPRNKDILELVSQESMGEVFKVLILEKGGG